ncbi:PPC domain-containing protein [Spartinivicinus poritis]|uniref:PPC domain-containing protein n=1 Tax=Spartinivicinus poritis TaxID=2994640 RepID=A0ABT5UDG5_9GAMM|nr:PPC domain-containing protein [Spartinivicinus sp. A2-2]MDE1464041.1 PPC domain-containing protein [Spartinivicinus sp. A2-2]
MRIKILNNKVTKSSKFIRPSLLLSLCVSAICSISYANTCPPAPEKFAVPIPNPDPGSPTGKMPLDINKVMPFIKEKGISNVKEFIDALPDSMHKNYSIIEKSRALGQTDINHPGLLMFGSDARFMVNISTKKSDPRYEMVDIAHLDNNGNWVFRALDFSSGSPKMGKNDIDCQECHGKPARPFWGEYLDWPGIFSDDGRGNEKITNRQAVTLTRIKQGQQNSERFHQLKIPDYYFDKAGTAMHLPNHVYGPALTIFNNKLAGAVASSIHKRARKSANYNGLREEYLALSYCDTSAGVLSQQAKDKIKQLIESKKGKTTGYNGSPHWSDILSLWGLDPKHELPLHKLSTEEVKRQDLDWNTGVSRLREVVDLAILMELAKENNQLNALLAGNPSSWPMTSCGNPFSTLKDHLTHKLFANFTLRNEARQTARESYYDIDYLRIHQSMDYITTSFCHLLSENISEDTIGKPSKPDDDIPSPPDDGDDHDKPNPPDDGDDHDKPNPPDDGDDHDKPNPPDDGDDNDKPTPPDDDINQLPVKPLFKGKPASNLSDNQGKQQMYTIHVHGKPSNLKFSVEGGQGDVDLYVRHNKKPNLTQFDCRPLEHGTNETCLFKNPKMGLAGSWYVLLNSNKGFSGVTLTADYQDSDGDDHGDHDNGQGACAHQKPSHDVAIFDNKPLCVTPAPNKDHYRHYYIRLPQTDAGKTLEITMKGGTGNADLLVSADLGQFPHEEHYESRPDIVFGSTNPDNTEKVTIKNAKAGKDYLITLPAVSAHKGITITAAVR